MEVSAQKRRYFSRKFLLGVIGSTSLLIIFLLTRSTTAWEPESDHPWPMFHGNYNHTGYVDVKGPREGTLKWKFKAGSGEENQPPPNSVAIDANGMIYVGSPEKIYAIRPKGNVKWSKSYTNVQGPALSADGETLYFAENNALMAVRTKDGKKKWKYSMDNSTLFGPTIGPDGTIYQGSWDSYLYAIKSNGKLKWKYQTAGAVSYPASIMKSGLIILGGGDAHAGPDSYVYAIKPDGSLNWKYDTGSSRVGSPAIGTDGLIYIPAAPKLLVLNKKGTLEWSLGPETSGDDSEDTSVQEDIGEPPTDGEDEEDIGDGGEEAQDDIAGIITPAIGPDGTIYIGNSQGVISAVNPTTQEVKWTYQTGADPDDTTMYGLPSFPVVDKGGAVYFGSVDGYMYALNKKGELLWSYQTGGGISESAPALGPDGTLYFTSEDGYLYAIQD